MNCNDIFDDEDPQVQMGPMIDCVFLLLIFFMVVALTKKSYRELQLNQREAIVQTQTESDTKPERFAVTVGAKGGRYTVTGLEGDVDLRGAIQAIQTRGLEAKDKLVWIETHEASLLGAVIPILDACKQYGLDVMYFRTVNSSSK